MFFEENFSKLIYVHNVASQIRIKTYFELYFAIIRNQIISGKYIIKFIAGTMMMKALS